MINSAPERTRSAKVPLLKGCLWFDPKLETLWQCQRIYGPPGNPDNCIIEVTGMMLNPEELRIVEITRRMPVLEFVDRFIYFGSVHHTDWSQRDENI